MRPLSLLAALTLIAAACAMNVGGQRDIDLSAVALRAAPDAAPADVAGSLVAADADVALITGTMDSAWLAAVAQSTGLTVSGPAASGDLTMAFLAGEPLGDTTVVLSHEHGRLTIHDALYEVRKERYLDLMVLRLDDPAAARSAIGALLQYMATDVMNAAAVVMAVHVPSAAAGDSVARMLSPAYFDAIRCEPGLAPPSDRAGIRLFYGPEARAYCRSASVDAQTIGDVTRARLTLGRR